jgi:hypothetical protein
VKAVPNLAAVQLLGGTGADDIYEARGRRKETRGVLIMLCGRNTFPGAKRRVSSRGRLNIGHEYR